MQPTSNQDYKQLLSEVIKKQIVILGPDITLSKARNVKGLTVANDGTVTSVEGKPQEVTQALIDQFVQLSGLIVKKTMEPLLSMSEAMPAATSVPTPSPIPAAPTTTPPTTQTQSVTPTVSTNQIDPAAQAIIDQALAQQPATTTPSVPAQTPAAQPITEPAKNPLAA